MLPLNVLPVSVQCYHLMTPENTKKALAKEIERVGVEFIVMTGEGFYDQQTVQI